MTGQCNYGVAAIASIRVITKQIALHTRHCSRKKLLLRENTRGTVVSVGPAVMVILIHTFSLLSLQLKKPSYGDTTSQP